MSNTKSNKNSAYSWLVLIMITLCYTCTFFSRFVWSPVMSEAAGDIGMTMSQAGGLMSAFYFGYLILQIPAGIVADRIRVKYPMFICMLLIAGSTWLMSSDIVSSYTSAYVVRFMGGFFSGTIMACASRLLSNYFEAKVRGIAFGILLASPSLGTLLANQIGPRVLEASGWRVTFQVCAIIILVIGVLAVVLIREPKAEPMPANAPKSSLLDGLKNYFSNKQLILLSIAGFLFMAVPTGYSTWANQFMTGAAPAGGGLSSVDGGTIVTCYAVASVIGSMSSGFIGKKFNWNRKYLIMEIYIAMAIFLFIFGMQRKLHRPAHHLHPLRPRELLLLQPHHHLGREHRRQQVRRHHHRHPEPAAAGQQRHLPHRRRLHRDGATVDALCPPTWASGTCTARCSSWPLSS